MENQMSEITVEDRIKKLERTVNIMRFAMIALVVFMVAEILSKDTGSRVIFADKIKAREYVLLGSGDQPVANWDNKETYGLKMYDKEGNHVLISPQAVTFYEDRLNPVVKSKYD